MMTVRRMTEAETAPRITKRDGDTEESSTDLVGSESSSRAESGSEMEKILGEMSTFCALLSIKSGGKHLKQALFDVQFRV